MSNTFSPADLEELRTLILRSKNLNSAVKSYLKHEVEKQAKEIRFLKAIRKVSLPTQKKQLMHFLEQCTDEYAIALFILVRHAYFHVLSPVLEEVIREKAEVFNATYTSHGDEITIKDEKTFQSVVQEVSKMLDDALAKEGFGGSKMLHKIFMHLLYDAAVVEHATPVHFQDLQLAPVAIGQ
jgi:hypothetical protein